MIAVGFDLKSLIQNLRAIESDGQLDALLLDYSQDCRGLCDDAAHLNTALDLYQARKIAKILVTTCGMRLEEAEAATRSVLLPHPRRESLVRLAEEYTRDATSFAKLERERKKGGEGAGAKENVRSDPSSLRQQPLFRFPPPSNLNSTAPFALPND